MRIHVGLGHFMIDFARNPHVVGSFFDQMSGDSCSNGNILAMQSNMPFLDSLNNHGSQRCEVTGKSDTTYHFRKLTGGGDI
jgi:hypothetical protein